MTQQERLNSTFVRTKEKPLQSTLPKPDKNLLGSDGKALLSKKPRQTPAPLLSPGFFRFISLAGNHRFPVDTHAFWLRQPQFFLPETPSWL